MRRSTSFVGLTLLLVACGGKKPAVTPVPDPGTGTTGTTVTPPPAATPPAADPNANRGDPNAAATTADLVRVMQEAIYFDYDQDGLKPEGQATLDRKAAIMLANPGLRIRISGHADERGSDEYNVVLGTRRAATAKRYLESRGIDGSRIETISYGEERPVDNAANEAAFAKNRRDEFEMTAGADRLVKPQ